MGGGQSGDDGVLVGAQSGQVDDGDVLGPHGAVGLLLDPGGQVRGGVAEGLVAGELGLPDGDEAGLRAARVVRAVDGDAAGVGEGRGQDDAVHAGARALEEVGDGGGLEGVVAAQGGVGAGDEGDRAADALGCGQGVGDHLDVEPLGVRRVETAGVRHDVDGRRPGGQGPGEVLDAPSGHDGQVGDGLGAGGVVVQDDQGAGQGRGHGGRVDDGARGQARRKLVQSLHECTPSCLCVLAPAASRTPRFV